VVAIHPENLATGYLSLLAGLLCLGWSVLELLDERTGTGLTVFFAVFAVVAVLCVVSASNGLKALMRQRAEVKVIPEALAECGG
jgi:hypothetical protein